ncbi:MAG: transglutaminase family protein [Limisphaerales bacterium]
MKYLLYHISHRTIYDYASPVSVSHHLVRLRPRTSANQRCQRHEVTINPESAATSLRRDYFGNDHQFVTIEGAHEKLEVIAESEVAVALAFIPDAAETPPWQVARGMALSDHSLASQTAREFVFESPRIRITEEIREYATESFPKGRPLMEAALELTRRIHQDFEFDPTATDVTTPLDVVFAKRKGVCQDFSHFEIACLRSLGIPARYVSGYLETDPPPGQVKLVGSDASHAWTSFYCPGIGWIDVDPTNNCIPSMRHITVAYGRDYGDVAPLRGVIVGSGEHILTVGVDVIPKGPIDLQ